MLTGFKQKRPVGRSKSKRKKWLILATGFGLLVFLLAGYAQQRIVLENFKFAPGAYYPPPHQKQLKSLLTGVKAEERPGGVYFITAGKFETFLEAGTREMLVEAPSCIYENTGDHSIHSPGPLRVIAADEKFSITGEGFRWQTNSTLFVSNQVHTILHPELLQAQNATSATTTNKAKAGDNGIDIVSDELDYRGESGIGNYRRNVRVKGTDLDMTAGALQFLLPMKQRQLKGMKAEEDVSITSGEVHATGQHLDYAPDTGLIRVTGDPKWQAAQREGQAEELSIDRSNRIFRATGNAILKLAGQGAVTSAFLSENAASATNRVVEIQCARYVIRTNSAEFTSNVIVTERSGDQPRAKLSCAHMTATFTGTNQMERMNAEENVVIEQGTKRFFARQAAFTGTNQILTLTGNPTWQDGTRNGKADVLFLRGQENELAARGNASLQLPARNIGPAGTANLTVSPGSTNQFAEISSPEYTLRTNSALFQGGVLVTDPQMKLHCQTLTLDMPGSDVRAQSLVAQDAVNFDLVDEKGQKINGTAQKAVYTYNVSAGKTNDLVELTGKPKLAMEDGSTFENSVIIMDRAKGKLIAPGKYLIRNFSTAPMTNDFKMMKPGSRKKSKGPA